MKYVNSDCMEVATECMKCATYLFSFMSVIYCFSMAAVDESSRRHQSSGGNVAAPTSAYHEYPPSQPFINDDYRRDVTKPIIAYPESNRQG